MTEEKSSETTLCVASDLIEANFVRSELLQTTYRLWLFVTKNAKGQYTIGATNEYGGRLPDAHAIVLREKCQKLIKVQPIDDETKDDDNEESQSVFEWSDG